MSVASPALGESFDQCEQSSELYEQAQRMYNADADRAIRRYHEAFFSASTMLQAQLEEQGTLSRSCFNLLAAQSKASAVILSTAFPEVTESDLTKARKEHSTVSYALILNSNGTYGKVLPAFFLESDLLRARAQVTLWAIYENGLENVVQRHSKDIRKYYESRAAWGVPRLQYYLGLIYLRGLGVPKDTDKAERLLIEASANVTEAARELGSYYYREQDDLAQGERYLLMAADTADAEAHYELGSLYFCGERQDLSLDHFKQSFQIDPSSDNSHALLWVGRIYLEGVGVKRDCTKAIEALEKSADHFKNYTAQYYLSLYYRAKEGYRSECIEPNLPKGLSYLRAAAAQGDESAVKELKGQ